jgi:thiamine-phosphate pyrophosphorylase
VTPQPQIYVVLEIGNGDAAAATRLALEAVLSAAPVSSLMIRPAPGGALKAHFVKPLVDLCQRRGVAVLIADDAALARVVKADGVHVSWGPDLVKRTKAARDDLGARALVGADAGRSRDDAMSLGEAGADYVAFGIPAHVEDRATAQHRQVDLIAWWAEIFEVPCVALDVANADQAHELANCGADFIALTVSDQTSAADAKKRAQEFADAISAAEAPA